MGSARLLIMQVTFGNMLVSHARRCWDLTAAVPQEYEGALWEQGEQLIAIAALFGDEESEKHVKRDLDRSWEQRDFFEVSGGF
jgi:hypothetical protein